MIARSPALPPPAPRSNRPLLAGRDVELVQNAFGQAVRISQNKHWRHPWFTAAHYDFENERWIATIKPGFVNGACPIYAATVEEAKKEGRDFGINPLTGLPYFSSFVFNRNPATKSKVERIDIPLYNVPTIELGFRNIGADGAGSTVPEFFQKKGVQNGPTLDGNGGIENLLADALNFQPKPGNRLLRACDLVLHQPRQALTSTLVVQPGLATGLSNYTQTLTLRDIAPGDRLKVFATAKFLPPATIYAAEDDYEEPNFDELLISTVFLFSPPNLPLNSVPDASWSPYVAHSLFWNLSYATPAFEIRSNDPDLRFNVPLGGGVANIFINLQTATINDAFARSLNIVNAQSMAGSWWTSTGGGSESAFPLPPEPKAAGRTGLDKDGRLLAKRRAAAQALRAATLDPIFPYRGLPFPTAFLT